MYENYMLKWSNQILGLNYVSNGDIIIVDDFVHNRIQTLSITKDEIVLPLIQWENNINLTFKI